MWTCAALICVWQLTQQTGTDKLIRVYMQAHKDNRLYSDCDLRLQLILRLIHQKDKQNPLWVKTMFVVL